MELAEWTWKRVSRILIARRGERLVVPCAVAHNHVAGGTLGQAELL